MSSTKFQYSDEEQSTLLSVAATSILRGLERDSPFNPDVRRYVSALQEFGASFVTLTINHQLRGCIGMLSATRPLVSDVAANAFSAAFEDPRFPRLKREEYERLDIHISILSPPQPILFESEDELLSLIRPGIDGLILKEGFRRGTFLPSVWESLPDKRAFLNNLKLKAGLSADYWSDQISVERYTTFSFGALSKSIQSEIA